MYRLPLIRNSGVSKIRYISVSKTQCFSSSSGNTTLLSKAQTSLRKKYIPVDEELGKSRKNASIYVWGASDGGALGIGPTKKIESTTSSDDGQFIANPTKLSYLESYQPYAIAAGWGHSLIAAERNGAYTLLASGLNKSGQLGAPSNVLLRNSFSEVASFSKNVLSMACGREHSVVATTDGVVAFGNNHYGQCGFTAKWTTETHNFVNVNLMLGIPNDISKEESVWKVAPSALTPTPTPTPTSSLIHTLETPLQVACGLDLTLILHDGVVFSCGWAADGQTGQGTDQDTICLSPIAFSVEPKDIAVSTARSNSDLGKASSTLVAATAADNKPPLYQIKQVSTRADCSFALLEILNSKQRLLYTWGNSEYGQTSLGKKNDKYLSPTLVSGIDGNEIQQISAGGSFSLFLTLSGQIFSCGYGPALGLGPNCLESLNLKEIDLVWFEGERVVSLSCGADFAVAVTANGSIFSWGRNQWSRLGLGSTNDAWYPTRVPIEGRVVAATCGIDHVLAIVED